MVATLGAHHPQCFATPPFNCLFRNAPENYVKVENSHCKLSALAQCTTMLLLLLVQAPKSLSGPFFPRLFDFLPFHFSRLFVCLPFHLSNRSRLLAAGLGGLGSLLLHCRHQSSLRAVCPHRHHSAILSDYQNDLNFAGTILNHQ